MPNPMIIISWNCRELENSRTIQDLYNMTKEKKPKIMFLIEALLITKKLEGVRKRLGYGNYFGVDFIGRRGGLAII